MFFSAAGAGGLVASFSEAIEKHLPSLSLYASFVNISHLILLSDHR